jgi:phage shock protein PspC (stress-responsive transcriptional regulator)
MKKTVNINLGGIIFHIDEDAFEQLNAYLLRIKLHYKEEEGCEEIASDIEARIAELLQEKSIQIISIGDVDALILIMGEPEAYEESEEETTSQEEPKSSTSTKKTKKRIYRDKDNEVVGGVCSGIAAYFDIDPVIIRLLALVGMFAGGGILVYLILWAIIPEAKTTAEKLQMKGEAVNAENIKKTIQKEFDNLKTTVENINAEDHKNKARNIFQKIISFFLNIIGYIFKFIGKFIGLILLIMGVSLCFMIVANLFGSGTSLIQINGNNVHPLNLNQFFPLIFDGSKLSGLSIFGLVLFIGVPVVQIIWLAVRILFSIPKQSTTTRTVLASIWVIGIILLIYVGSKTSSNFSCESYNTSTVDINIQSDTLYLELSDNNFFNTHQKGTSFYYDEDLNSLLTTEVDLDIKKSINDSYQLKINKFANGSSQKQAKINAEKIDYDYSLEDNTLNFSNYLSVEPNEGFRFQEVKIVLYVPEGKTVYLDNSVKHFISDVDNTTDTYDKRMVNHYWKMNHNLDCLDCN